MRIAKRLALLVVFIAACILATIVPMELATADISSLRNQSPLVAMGAHIALHMFIFSLTLSLAWLFTTRIDRRSMSDVWLLRGKKSLGLLATGTAITVVAGGLACGLYFWMESPSLSHQGVGMTQTLAVLLLALVATLFQAATEEVFFRSWALRTLVDLSSERTAAILMGAIFGLIHLANPNYSLAAVANAGTAGVMLCYAVFHTRSIWMSVGLHLGWNFIISGTVLNRSLVTVVTQERTRLDQAGMEATVQAAVLVAIVTLVVIALPRIGGPARWIDEK